MISASPFPADLKVHFQSRLGHMGSPTNLWGWRPANKLQKTLLTQVAWGDWRDQAIPPPPHTCYVNMSEGKEVGCHPRITQNVMYGSLREIKISASQKSGQHHKSHPTCFTLNLFRNRGRSFSRSRGKKNHAFYRLATNQSLPHITPISNLLVTGFPERLVEMSDMMIRARVHCLGLQLYPSR